MYHTSTEDIRGYCRWNENFVLPGSPAPSLPGVIKCEITRDFSAPGCEKFSGKILPSWRGMKRWQCCHWQLLWATGVVFVYSGLLEANRHNVPLDQCSEMSVIATRRANSSVDKKHCKVIMDVLKVSAQSITNSTMQTKEVSVVKEGSDGNGRVKS